MPKAVHYILRIYGLGAILCLLVGHVAFGQAASQAAANATATSNDTSAFRTALAQRLALMAQMRTLMETGATPQQMEAWQKEHGNQLIAVNQKLVALTPVRPLPPVTATIPTNVTAEMKEFLQNRATLGNLMRQDPTFATHTPSASTAALMQRQVVLSQIIAQQQAKNNPFLPATFTVPAGTSPQLAAYLTAHHQLMAEQMQLMAQYQNADPATREAALEDWVQKNSARFNQIDQMVQTLSTPNTTSGATQ